MQYQDRRSKAMKAFLITFDKLRAGHAALEELTITYYLIYDKTYLSVTKEVESEWRYPEESLLNAAL